jgi:hypothetical protein
LEATNDYCQFTFSTAGSYSVTVPSSASELYAILVGSGSGVGADQSNNVAYAGSGGQVKYINLSDQIDTPITVNVGAGGASSTNQSATPGTDTTLIYSSTGASAWTGSVTNANSCTLTTYTSGVASYIMYAGKDGKLTDRVASYTDSCTNSFGVGVNPSAGNTDSDNNPVPAIFSNYNANLGVGGQVSTNVAPAAAGFGAGGSFTVSDTDLTFSNVQAGHDGAAIFRWKQKQLSNTGSDSQGLSSIAAGLITLGAGLMFGSRLRRRPENKH